MIDWIASSNPLVFGCFWIARTIAPNRWCERLVTSRFDQFRNRLEFPSSMPRTVNEHIGTHDNLLDQLRIYGSCRRDAIAALEGLCSAESSGQNVVGGTYGRIKCRLARYPITNKTEAQARMFRPPGSLATQFSVNAREVRHRRPTPSAKSALGCYGLAKRIIGEADVDLLPRSARTKSRVASGPYVLQWERCQSLWQSLMSKSVASPTSCRAPCFSNKGAKFGLIAQFLERLARFVAMLGIKPLQLAAKLGSPSMPYAEICGRGWQARRVLPAFAATDVR